MENIVFIIAILSLAVSLFMFIGKVLTDGLAKTFSSKNKSTNIMLYSFLLYIITFAIYIVMSGEQQ